jgi:hypothetical protein
MCEIKFHHEWDHPSFLLEKPGPHWSAPKDVLLGFEEKRLVL